MVQSTHATVEAIPGLRDALAAEAAAQAQVVAIGQRLDEARDALSRGQAARQSMVAQAAAGGSVAHAGDIAQQIAQAQAAIEALDEASKLAVQRSQRATMMAYGVLRGLAQLREEAARGAYEAALAAFREASQKREAAHARLNSARGLIEASDDRLRSVFSSEISDASP